MVAIKQRRQRSWEYGHAPRANLSETPFASAIAPSTSQEDIAASANDSVDLTMRQSQARQNSFDFGLMPLMKGPRVASLSAKHYPIQARLTLGTVGDPYEQEADRVATDVVDTINQPKNQSLAQRMSEAKIDSDATVQRTHINRPRLSMRSIVQATSQTERSVPEAFEASIQTAGRGQPLDKGLQQTMGQTMGADFSSVKVHTDAHADQLNQQVQAKAFTHGQDVFFRQGEYKPSSKQGQELIAHELTHVVQQGQAETINRSAGMIQCNGDKKQQVNSQNNQATQTAESSKKESYYTPAKVAKEGSNATQKGAEIYDDAKGIADQTEYISNPEKLEFELGEANKKFSELMSMNPMEWLESGIIDTYFSFIEKLDFLGVSDILKSIGNLKHASIEKRKMAVLDRYAGNDVLAELVGYAKRKIKRSYITSWFRGIMDAIKAASRWISLISAGAASAVTETIKLIASLISMSEKLYRNIKGIVKFFKRTKGVNRKKYANLLLDLALSGDRDACMFLIEFNAAQSGWLQRQFTSLIIKEMSKEKLESQINSFKQNQEIIDLIMWFKGVKNENTMIKLIWSQLVNKLADSFKSQPPSGASLLSVILKEEGAQELVSFV